MSSLKKASTRLSQLAKCLSPMTSGLTTMSSKQVSTSNNEPHQEVMFTKNLNSRIVTLNRPAVYNALNLNMIRRITEKFKIWETCNQTNVIVLKSDLPKAFCAGGDVKTIVQKLNKGDHDYGLQFFTEEYTLNHMIATCPKPVVAFMNGITMGGGVGLSIHAPFRVATETSVLAMPETAIGFFPDVGGTFFLPRMAGGMGTFLALTGNRMEAGDLTRYGLATHFIPAAALPHVLETLGQAGEQWESVHILLESYSIQPPPSRWRPHQPWIDRCFQHTSLNAIYAALHEESDPTAQETLKQLQTMCPLSLHLTLMQLQEGKSLDIASAFSLEWGLARLLSQHPDFVEGVTAKLMEKRLPTWKTLERTQEVAEEIFQKAKNLSPPTPFLSREITYMQYPYRLFGFPQEDEDWPMDVTDFRQYFRTYYPNQLQRISNIICKVGLSEH